MFGYSYHDNMRTSHIGHDTTGRHSQLCHNHLNHDISVNHLIPTRTDINLGGRKTHYNQLKCLFKKKFAENHFVVH